ncbi:uncharacterized protein PFL1_04111 [Pseudozyma flocculosa PF-1]|uniref:Origin recognition complex subunit 5 n=2 Tax=Pseudozyma flocculosa TaxID=84751 RepID=A0A5C3ET36_9BASI|nr:uncharacterized protein PFL1_04111 [Pseudozyma flocculosa PF-1]EPQ28284.1 hypothetical protein PFL1_04111 [Pseudozyma flocculosa PF-1]SPO35428.1 uncharacterized protein PSFLO_00899 [Pseudozyma flocculosa]
MADLDAAAAVAGDADQTFEQISLACPGRTTQLRMLLNLLGTAHQPMPGSILLQDPCSPARTASYAKMVLRTLADQPLSGLHPTVVSPLTSSAAPALFRDLLEPLEASLGSTAPASTSRRADGSLDWFLWRVSALLSANPSVKVAVLIENAERIRDVWPETVWTTFCRLGELTASQGRITTVFVSSLPWSNYRTPSGLTTVHGPVVIRFPRHTKEEVISILLRDFDPLYAAYHRSVLETRMRANTAVGLVQPHVFRILKRRDTMEMVDRDSLRRLYSSYLGLFYDSISSHVRDVAQMRVMSAAVWHAFVVPVQAGEATTGDTQLLLLASSHLFRDVLVRLQTSEVGPKEWTEEARHQSIKACEDRLTASAERARLQVEAPAGEEAGNNPQIEAVDEDLLMVDEETKIDQEEWRERDAERTKKRRLSTQLANTSTLASLPLIPTFLLLSSFLASYNPSRLDVRYFLRDSSLIGQSSAASKGGTGGRKFGPGRGRRIVRRARGAKNGAMEEGATENLNRQELLGPKSFPVDRLLSIFQALITECGPELNNQLALSVVPGEVDANGLEVEGDVGAMWEERARSVGVYTQINNLVSRRMLVRTSAPDRLGGSVNFRTNVGYTVVATLARKVRFDLDEWLWDWGGGGAGAA